MPDGYGVTGSWPPASPQPKSAISYGFTPQGPAGGPPLPGRQPVGGGYTGPASLNRGGYGGGIQSAIATYESMAQDYQPQRGGGEAYTYAPPDQPEETWRYGSPADVTRAQYGGGGGGGGGRAVAPQAPLAMPRFKFDQQLDLPDYSPPEEDPQAYRAARQEAMGRGERAIRNRAQEAIMSSKSIDNPQARKQFINSVLSGVGEGLEAVAAGAGREARQVTGAKRAEQMQVYNAKYQAQSQEAMSRYEQGFKTALLNYQAGASEAQANVGVPGATAGAPGGFTGMDAWKQRYMPGRRSRIPGFAG